MLTYNVALLGLVATAAQAYSNNCSGSMYSPTLADCRKGQAQINKSASYADGAQFSYGDCYIVYATNGAGVYASGQIISNTIDTILSQCSTRHGSYGTNNGCTSCHVTVNYRVPKKRSHARDIEAE